METLKPVGPCQHSGTFNAPLVNILCGLAFLEEARKPDFYPSIRRMEAFVKNGFDEIIRRHGLNMVVVSHGPQFNITFGRTDAPVRYEDSFTHDPAVMRRFCREMFERGVYFHDYGGGPSHHGFSIAHTEESLSRMLSAAEEALTVMQAEGLC